MTDNIFSVLSLNSVDFQPKAASSATSSKIGSKKVSIPKNVEVSKKPKDDGVYDLQSMYSLIMFVFSGFTNNEFVIGKINISPEMKLKKNATIQDLNTLINKMDLPFYCLVWGTSINTPELKKMIENQYKLPKEYQHLHDLMCDDNVKSMKRQNVIILDFRRPHLKGKEYVYLQNHQQFFFGSVRESYIIRKSNVNELKKEYYSVCHSFKFNFDKLDKVIFDLHMYALTGADTEWIEFRQNLIQQFRDAAEVFNLSDFKVYERFPTLEDLNKEAESVKYYIQEIMDMHPKMKKNYEGKMLADETKMNYDDAFPSL